MRIFGSVRNRAIKLDATEYVVETSAFFAVDGGQLEARRLHLSTTNIRPVPTSVTLISINSAHVGFFPINLADISQIKKT